MTGAESIALIEVSLSTLALELKLVNREIRFVMMTVFAAARKRLRALYRFNSLRLDDRSCLASSSSPAVIHGCDSNCLADHRNF